MSVGNNVHPEWNVFWNSCSSADFSSNKHYSEQTLGRTVCHCPFNSFGRDSTKSVYSTDFKFTSIYIVQRKYNREKHINVDPLRCTWELIFMKTNFWEKLKICWLWNEFKQIIILRINKRTQTYWGPINIHVRDTILDLILYVNPFCRAIWFWWNFKYTSRKILINN